MTIIYEYLRAITLGSVARMMRIARGRPCPCSFCRGHRAFVRRGGGDPSRAFLPTLDQTRDGRDQ